MDSPEDLLGPPALRGSTGSVLPAAAQAFPLRQMTPSGTLAGGCRNGPGRGHSLLSSAKLSARRGAAGAQPSPSLQGESLTYVVPPGSGCRLCAGYLAWGHVCPLRGGEGQRRIWPNCEVWG